LSSHERARSRALKSSLVAQQRTRLQAEGSRDRIIAAARHIFELQGARGATTREIARRAGVNETTIFRLFGSKNALLAAMRELAFGHENFGDDIGELTGEDIIADLRLFAAKAVSQFAMARRLMLIAIAEDAIGSASDCDPDYPEWRALPCILTPLVDLFQRLVEDGRLTGKPDFLARVLVGLTLQFVIARELWPVVNQSDIDQGSKCFCTEREFVAGSHKVVK
jgi:AcrR family transcriptional regulator